MHGSPRLRGLTSRRSVWTSSEDAQSPVGASSLADRMYFEADLLECTVLQDTSPIEEEGRLQHLSIELVVRVLLEFVPLCQHHNGMSAIHCLVWRGCKGETVWVHVHIVVLELGQSILFFHLRVEHMHQRAILQEIMAHRNRWGLADIARILLESETPM